MYTNTPPSHESGLTDKARHDVLERVLKALESKFYKPELLGQGWQNAVASHRATIESAATPEAFEQAMMDCPERSKPRIWSLMELHGGIKSCGAECNLPLRRNSIRLTMDFQDVQ